MDKCPKCGSDARFLAGRPAHHTNLYCDNCGWEAWNTRTHVSVPVEPTEEMIEAGRYYHSSFTDEFYIGIYKAMIAASKEGKDNGNS